jgi:hypothetical protein
VAGWDDVGNPVASEGRSITGRNLSYAYAATTHACEGATGLKVIIGFDRHSVRSATQKVAYVAASRGREGIEAFVEPVADLPQIQNRAGDRKAAVEMAFEPDQNDRRERWSYAGRLRKRPSPARTKNTPWTFEKGPFATPRKPPGTPRPWNGNHCLPRPRNASRRKAWSTAGAWKWACNRLGPAVRQIP